MSPVEVQEWVERARTAIGESLALAREVMVEGYESGRLGQGRTPRTQRTCSTGRRCC